MNTVPLIGNNVLLTDDGQLKIDTKANKATIRGTEVDIFYSDTGKTSFVTSLTDGYGYASATPSEYIQTKGGPHSGNIYSEAEYRTSNLEFG